MIVQPFKGSVGFCYGKEQRMSRLRVTLTLATVSTEMLNWVRILVLMTQEARRMLYMCMIEYAPRGDRCTGTGIPLSVM